MSLFSSRMTEVSKYLKIGDKLYIILSGSVKVLMKKDIFGDEPIVVATLYDGMQFGELAIFSGL